MATQRLTIATFAGESAPLLTDLFRGWRSESDPAVIDRFCASIRERGWSLPVIYFSEWVDRWLMGDLLPGPQAVSGGRFQAAIFTPDKAVEWASRCGDQWHEQEWFAARLREASTGWGFQTPYAVVVVRDVIGISTTDEEVEAAMRTTPDWLAAFTAPASPR